MLKEDSSMQSPWQRAIIRADHPVATVQQRLMVALPFRRVLNKRHAKPYPVFHLVLGICTRVLPELDSRLTAIHDRPQIELVVLARTDHVGGQNACSPRTSSASHPNTHSDSLTRCQAHLVRKTPSDSLTRTIHRAPPDLTPRRAPIALSADPSVRSGHRYILFIFPKLTHPRTHEQALHNSYGSTKPFTGLVSPLCYLLRNVNARRVGKINTIPTVSSNQSELVHVYSGPPPSSLRRSGVYHPPGFVSQDESDTTYLVNIMQTERLTLDIGKRTLGGLLARSSCASLPTKIQFHLKLTISISPWRRSVCTWVRNSLTKHSV
ncbi:hypothetical protein THAOC_02423 [Thalassiosira oceanica]|uniref:Uncharacterized protein n=1 Tax=Thalassiosira oceanica TaxID=159749 RepID=K0TAR9_THAOC|nr:hypothetical protein THAOC_02423 [Thalassiosira oceanica]|eukprot:EJK75843.1 hypothetical protein THAOC_02423 [Thalassiosira oceanica]